MYRVMREQGLAGQDPQRAVHEGTTVAGEMVVGIEGEMQEEVSAVEEETVGG